MANDESDWLAHAARIREKIKAANEQADSLDHILPTIPDDETKRKIELVIQSYRLHANRLSEHIRESTSVTNECAECGRLEKEVESALEKLVSLARAQGEAFRQNKHADFVRLDKELENAVGHRERVTGALRQHKADHHQP